MISGSEDGSVHWFDLERGDLVAVTTLATSTIDPVMAVAFHPTCHAIALCSLSSQCCLSVLEFLSVFRVLIRVMILATVFSVEVSDM